MASYVLDSQLPQLSKRHTPPIDVGVTGPFTPVHSPHHSVTSSVSSRTPVHTLSIHEYRKQLNTPSSESATPAGKTLRRKAAAQALNGLERVSSVASSTRRGTSSAPRPLHVSQSAHQLHTRSPPSQPTALSNLLSRSQSVEPRLHGQGVSISSESTVSAKVRHFNPRKRLPKPPSINTGGSQVCHPRPTDTKTYPLLQTQPLSPLDLGIEASRFSDTRTTTTVSTLSLSRFPQPPNYSNQTHPQDDVEHTRLNTASYATIAPATPPATPATIHYRGASFDLVNPHDSLILHSIVTPSKDFGSSEYLEVPSPEDLVVVSSEMAPKRPLYGDLSAAHAGIMRRAEDPFSPSSLDLPLPPTPAAVSPGSSAYTSPVYSSESNLAPSPLAITKATNESRFSLKQLTRTLTRRLGKPSENGQVQEMQDLHRSDLSISTVDLDGNIPQSLKEACVTTPEASYFPLNPASPTSPEDPHYAQCSNFVRGSYAETEHLERTALDTLETSETEPLTSMLPDEPSTEMGRAERSNVSKDEKQASPRPYYEDLDSIYRSSSIYTADHSRMSSYRGSINSRHRNNPFLRYGSIEMNDSANSHPEDSSYNYRGHQSVVHGEGKTDTISKIIDQYRPNTKTDHVAASFESHQDMVQEEIEGRQSSQRATPDLSHFNFGLKDGPYSHRKDKSFGNEPAMEAGRSVITRDIGSPPQQAAPLAPPFEFDEKSFHTPRQEQSLLFSNGSSYSYGDTHNLLHIPSTTSLTPIHARQGLQPSSSYSQSQNGVHVSQPSSPRTPKAALDQAEEIFGNMHMRKQDTSEAIPAMWARRSSGSLLISKKSMNEPSAQANLYESDITERGADEEENDGDWESLVEEGRGVRESFSSYADYSSSDESRNSQSFSRNDAPQHELSLNQSQSLSIYSRSSSARTHLPPFNSSPPYLPTQRIARNGNETPSLPVEIGGISGSERNQGGQPTVFAPWINPYAFSDKETEELLASGPNDKIMFDDGNQSSPRSDHGFQPEYSDEGPSSSPPARNVDDMSALERENTFEKLCFIGPKGNLTGTPQGSGMHETGSSIADTSSPGVTMSSPTRLLANVQDGRAQSQVTLFPRASEIEPVLGKSTHNRASQRLSLRCSTISQRDQRRTSRTAVLGQTKLRQMILSPGNTRKTLTSQDTSFSRFLGGSERPSTSDTNTPLHRNLSINSFTTSHPINAHQHSPHLLCPERALNAEDEERRRKLSWAILALFCLLPPCIMLYRLWGDSIIASLTNGHLGHCTPKSKKVALIAGIAINVGIAVAIVVPIVIVHALGVV